MLEYGIQNNIKKMIYNDDTRALFSNVIQLFTVIAVELVQIRGIEMQRASDSVDSALMTVFLSHKAKLPYALKAAKEYCQVRQQIEDPVCEVSNYLFPDAKVIGGNTEVCMQ